MAQEAAVPLTTIQDIARRIAQEEVEKFARSGFLRNASITGGAGLTVKDGGRLSLVTPSGVTLFTIGPTGPSLPDGTVQQGWVVRRADGTVVLDLWDIDVSDGVIRQALNWRDRSGNAVIADDTDGGQGMARPFVPFVFYRARNADWPVVTSGSFEAVYRAKGPNQQPKVFVRAWGVNTVAGATGEMRLMVNSAQIDTTKTTVSGVVTEFLFGPLPVTGAHMSTLVIELQARLATGSGGVQVGMSQAQGQQT